MTMIAVSSFKTLAAVLIVSCLAHTGVSGFAPPGSSVASSKTTADALSLLFASSTSGDFGDTKFSELPYGEESRQYRRTYYADQDAWITHRSDDRFLGNMIKTFRSGIVRSLANEMTIVTSTALMVCFYNAVLVAGWQDFNGVMHDPVALPGGFVPPLASLPTEPFSLSSPALGLLLVFRTNASFGRWQEARNKWSAVMDTSRNIIRLGSGWMPADMPKEKQRELLEDLGDTIWAFARSLERYLLGEREDGAAYEQDIKRRMSPLVAQRLMDAPVKPNRALFELTKAVNAIPLSEHRHVEIDVGVEHLCEKWGGCEKLLRTPVPLVYTRHTARFLGFWILALPLGLWKSFATSWNHLGLIPAAVLIAFFFFGVEELAIQLEEPFSILPLKNFVKNIENSVDEVVEWHFEDDDDDDDAQAMNGQKRSRFSRARQGNTE